MSLARSWFSPFSCIDEGASFSLTPPHHVLLPLYHSHLLKSETADDCFRKQTTRSTFRFLHPLTTDIRNGIYYLVYTISNIRKRIRNHGKTQDIQPTCAGRSVFAHRATHASVRGFGRDAPAGAC